MKIRLFNLIMALAGTIIHAILYFININEINYSKIIYSLLLLIPVFAVLLVFFCILYWIFAVCVCLTCSNKKEYTKLSKFNTWFMLGWYEYFLLFMRTKISTSGLEKIPENKRFFIVCNHRSNFDNMVLSTVIKKEYITYISKPENFKIPLAGRIAKRALYLCMPKDDNRKALQTILQSIDYIKNDFMSVGVFPEGTRSKNGKILEFKSGCFKIPEKANCPIVVAVMDGTEKIHKNFPFHKTNINLNILKVYSEDEIKNFKTVELSDQIRNLMMQHFNQKNEV